MTKKIMTGNYNNCKTGNLISISGDRGKGALYEGKCMPGLAPKRRFWNVWHDNIGKIPEEENIRYYAREYYKDVLSKYDPMQLYNMLENETIFICYEDIGKFCHRYFPAFYLELFLGIHTSEVRVNSRRQTYHVQPRPEYLKDILEEVIKETYDMHGYNSLRAAYLYNTYIQLLKSIKEDLYDVEMSTGKLDFSGNELERYDLALQYRIKADEEEKKYVMSMSQKSID